jgi:hypothetical protein
MDFGMVFLMKTIQRNINLFKVIYVIILINYS